MKKGLVIILIPIMLTSLLLTSVITVWSSNASAYSDIITAANKNNFGSRGSIFTVKAGIWGDFAADLPNNAGDAINFIHNTTYFEYKNVDFGSQEKWVVPYFKIQSGGSEEERGYGESYNIYVQLDSLKMKDLNTFDMEGVVSSVTIPGREEYPPRTTRTFVGTKPFKVSGVHSVFFVIYTEEGLKRVDPKGSLFMGDIFDAHFKEVEAPAETVATATPSSEITPGQTPLKETTDPVAVNTNNHGGRKNDTADIVVVLAIAMLSVAAGIGGYQLRKNLTRRRNMSRRMKCLKAIFVITLATLLFNCNTGSISAKPNAEAPLLKDKYSEYWDYLAQLEPMAKNEMISSYDIDGGNDDGIAGKIKANLKTNLKMWSW